MKKLLTSFSHLSVIGLALLALTIGTVVWVFERVRHWARGQSPATSGATALSLKIADRGVIEAEMEFGEDSRVASDGLAASRGEAGS